MFEISAVKREILQKLAERNWTPTDLAKELDKSTETIYNHLEELAEMNILSKKKISAKTRPKTQYSIDNGFVQYLAVLPGKFTLKTTSLDTDKKAILRIWDIPQSDFHPFLENFWWSIRNRIDINFKDNIIALAIYGSVARGTANRDSDVDVLMIVKNEDTAEIVRDLLGASEINANGDGKIFMTQVYTKDEYLESKNKSSEFLEGIDNDLHLIYDPEGII